LIDTLAAATNNAHKLEEFKRILSGRIKNIVSIKDVLPGGCDPEETGKTFEENAAIKALAVYRATGLPVFADDSGLEVDALSGAPGIYSARYSAGGDAGNIDKLLKNLEDAENRRARFVCVIALVLPQEIANYNNPVGLVRGEFPPRPCRGPQEGNDHSPDNHSSFFFRGVTEGSILTERAGTGGFGYDPVFFSADLEKSFGACTVQEKDAVSHRRRALDQMLDFLTSF